MQNQTEPKSSNVVSLFGARKVETSDKSEEQKQEASSEKKEADSKESFLESMQRNFENAERLRKERLKANQSVLKSYRIKN